LFGLRTFAEIHQKTTFEVGTHSAMRFFSSIGKTNIADTVNNCSAGGGQKKRSWTSFRLFRGKKASKTNVDEKQSEMVEKVELENRILKWLSESSREDIPELELILFENSSQVDGTRAQCAPAAEEVGTNICQSGFVKCVLSEQKGEDCKDSTPSLKLSAKTDSSSNFETKANTCSIAPGRDILKPCHFQQGLLGLMSEGRMNFPPRLRMNDGLAFADSFRSIAAPLCGGAR
jgi:hypothetical protein